MPQGNPNPNYADLVPFGARRREAVEVLAKRALALYDESGIKDRYSVDSVYTLLVADQMQTLTWDGGRQDRECLDVIVKQFKFLIDNRASLSSAHQEAVRSSLGFHLIALDCQASAILRRDQCAFSDEDLDRYFPHIDRSIIPPLTLNASFLTEHPDGWTELGLQLAPVSLTLSYLYRDLVHLGFTWAASGPAKRAMWETVDQTLGRLDQCEQLCETLRPLKTAQLTASRKFDLVSLVNKYRRDAVRLDLLAHERMVEAVEAAVEASGAPSPELLLGWQVSRVRVQRDFVTIANMVKQHTDTRSLLYARRLFEMLEVCSSWTTLRGADPQTAAVLIAELGITDETGRALVSGLQLAAWSSPIAAQQLGALELGLSRPRPDPVQVEEATMAALAEDAGPTLSPIDLSTPSFANPVGDLQAMMYGNSNQSPAHVSPHDPYAGGAEQRFPVFSVPTTLGYGGYGQQPIQPTLSPPLYNSAPSASPLSLRSNPSPPPPAAPFDPNTFHHFGLSPPPQQPLPPQHQHTPSAAPSSAAAQANTIMNMLNVGGTGNPAMDDQLRLLLASITAGASAASASPAPPPASASAQAQETGFSDEVMQMLGRANGEAGFGQAPGVLAGGGRSVEPSATLAPAAGDWSWMMQGTGNGSPSGAWTQ